MFFSIVVCGDECNSGVNGGDDVCGGGVVVVVVVSLLLSLSSSLCLFLLSLS